jgi:type I restriction enzyme S subunit
MSKELKEIKFNDFARLKRGYDLPDSKMETGKYPVVASTSIKGFHNQYKVSPPVVVTGRSGSLGVIQFIETDCWPLNTSLYVKDYKGNYPKYVYYFLQTMHLENFNSGAGVPTLNQNHLHNQKVRVHKNFQIQKLVADTIGNYDQLIENNTKRIAILEQMTDQIYKEWFVRMRFPGYENTKLMKGIPEGWEVKSIKKFGKVITGKTPLTSDSSNYGGTFPFIKTPDMHGNTFVLNTSETLSQKGVDSQRSQLLPINAICVNCIGAQSGSVSLTTETCQTNQQIHSLIPKHEVYREFLFISIKNLREMIHLFGNTGSTMTNLSKGKYENLLILTPDSELIKSFHFNCKPMFDEIKNLGLQNIQLKESRNLLLPRLISGKLSVQQAEKTLHDAL